MDTENSAKRIFSHTAFSLDVHLPALQSRPARNSHRPASHRGLTECPACGHAFRAVRRVSRLDLGAWYVWYDRDGRLQIGRRGVGRIGNYKAMTGRRCPTMYTFADVGQVVFQLSAVLRASGFWVEDGSGRRRKAKREDFILTTARGRAKVEALGAWPVTDCGKE